MKYALIVIGIISIIAVPMLIHRAFVMRTTIYVEDTIKEKERIVKEESSKYIVFGENETYQNTDSLWYWKWNSSDIYGDLEEGKTYKMKIYGWRIPFLSMYKNIVSIEK